MSVDERGPRMYANACSVEASLFDFCLKFGLHDREQHERGERDEVTSIFVSPPHAKAIAAILGTAVKEYERNYGEIPLPKDVDTSESAQ